LAPDDYPHIEANPSGPEPLNTSRFDEEIPRQLERAAPKYRFCEIFGVSSAEGSVRANLRYSHVTLAMQTQAAAQLDAMLGATG